MITECVNLINSVPLSLAIEQQARHVSDLLSRSEDAQDVGCALTLLNLFAPVWTAAGHKETEEGIALGALGALARLSAEARAALRTTQKPTARRLTLEEIGNLEALDKGLRQRLWPK